MNDELLAQLARAWGIGDAYYDYQGQLRYFALATKAAIVQAMGADTEDDEALRRAIQAAEEGASADPAAVHGVTAEPCFQPLALIQGRRLWGVAVQLYGLRSAHNWGMGDFADLEDLVRRLAPLGAAFVGVNPLHALTLANPQEASPYSPCNRHFLNPLYIAVPAVPEFVECDAVARLVASRTFKARVKALRAGAWVDYRGVAQLKLAFLQDLFEHFQSQHLDRNSPRAAEYGHFVECGGNELRKHALFETLDEHFTREHGVRAGWQSWPPPFRDPSSAAVAEFAVAQAARVRFYMYLQWLATAQLAAAQRLACELGMPIGLYGDLAVGANPSGSEVWANRSLFCLEAEIGAPPDPIALKGQGWGLPPHNPRWLRETGFESFRRLIDCNTACFGALRIDHVMSLFRQWWVPAGMPPDAGAYVHYPLEHLLHSLASVSRERHCLVVGEDLGVVPDEIREALPRYGIYHYRVLWFEKDGAEFRSPDRYMAEALAVVSTHDLPTLAGYFAGRDLELLDQLKLYPNEVVRADLIRQREVDRQALMRAIGEGVPSERVHQYLARSAAKLVALQIEDVIGTVEPVNVPGTHGEYPNWRRKLDLDLEQIFADRKTIELLVAVDAARS